ncbi:suppressor protein SRP40-like [Aristolochia californica]|uniref:suppressor protein SRP40-like n=1 Tax=Aristolochia californica TaxID=171875 RepID=UPI0035D73256
MGSSSHTRQKPPSSKDKPKKRHRDASLFDSEDYSSSSDTDNDFRKKRKVSKKTKKPLRCSPSREDRNSRKRRSCSEQSSRSVKRKKLTRKRRRPSPSSDSCSAFSSWDSSSSDAIIHKRSRRSTHRVRQKVKSRRRSRYCSRSSGSCSSCSRSSHENSPPYINPCANVSKILKEQEQANSHMDEAKVDGIESNDYCPSSRSNDSNEAGRKEMQEVHASTNILEDVTNFEASVCVGDSSTDNLEAHLRQKALENFAKFRFGLLGNGKSVGNNNDASRISKSIWSEIHESRARVSENLTEGNEVSLGLKDCRGSSSQQSPVVKEDAECGVTMESDDRMPDEISLSKAIPDGQVTKIPKSTIEISNVSGLDVKAVGGTAPNEASNEGKGGAKSDSQLEQKMMSVMRGGELVQVSYKVFIPKKSPALGRRNLQR